MEMLHLLNLRSTAEPSWTLTSNSQGALNNIIFNNQAHFIE